MSAKALSKYAFRTVVGHSRQKSPRPFRCAVLGQYWGTCARMPVSRAESRVVGCMVEWDMVIQLPRVSAIWVRITMAHQHAESRRPAPRGLLTLVVAAPLAVTCASLSAITGSMTQFKRRMQNMDQEN